MTVNWNTAGWIIRSENRITVLTRLYIPLTPSHIAKKLQMSITHASKIIRELEKKGLIICLNDKDKRGRIYKRTKNGNEILKYVKKIEQI